MQPGAEVLLRTEQAFHRLPGDLNVDFQVNEDDAMYLLQHVLLPDFYPLQNA